MGIGSIRWVLVALVISSCSIATPFHRIEKADTDRSTEVWVDSVESFPGKTWIGLSVPYNLRAQRVLILRGMEANRTYRVTAHELLHSTGYGDHIPNKACYLFPSASNAPLGPPCAEEIRKTRNVRRTFYVTVLDPNLLPAVTWAIGMWNLASQRTLFVVR